MAPKPQEQISKVPEITPETNGKTVVVSGMSGLYPQSHNIKEFSDILYNKVNPVALENKRWKYNHPEVSQYLGGVPELDQFDAQFFKVHFRLGNSMDSMSRKVLEQTYQAIYDAGISPDELNGKKVAVFIGACFSETEKASFYVASTRTGFGIVGCNKSMFSNRISYWLNLKGPSQAIDEACCSSTAALAQAYQAIHRGDCEAAIVGGANLFLHPQSSVHVSRVILSCSDGKTKSFDENADGCVKSEAIQVVFLQRADLAKRVYAEIVDVKNSYTCVGNEFGQIYGFYRNPATTADILNKIYKDINIPPEAVEYVEAFGSAIPEADKSELEAISEVFCKNRAGELKVGSVMSNIGYTEASSGLCSLVKVLLGYHKGELAANLHLTTPRKDIPALHDGRMRILSDNEPFRRTYVAINNMSVTGCFAHVLLNGHYKPKELDRYKSSIPRLVTISARQETGVQKIFDDLKSRPIDPEELALLHNIHNSTIAGHLGRGFIILDTNVEQKTISLVEKKEYFDNARRPLWFVYSGMGSQWPTMGSHLMRIPIFAAAIERCHRALEPKGVDLMTILTSPDKTTFDNILHSFVGIAAVQIGLTDVLKELGLVPDKIIGHSVGELGCAYADGCFTAEEMILSAYSRGLVSIQTPFIKGSMAAVGIGYEKIKEMIPPEIEVACHNSSESSTISGPADIMREFVASLTAKSIFAKEVPCSNIAYHSRYIAEAGPGLLKYLSEVIKDPKPRSEKWVSTSVPFDRWEEPIAKYSSAEYHTNNLLNPVLFEETSKLIPSDAVLVEIAPHGLLQAILKRSLPVSCKHIPLTRRGHTDNTLMVLEGIGKLFMEGYHPDVAVLYPKVEFPVSTGTPMLSHLVEWAHNEVWNIPYYVAAHKKRAASTRNVITLHDDENSYLRGHVIKGKIVYPFAGALVAAWDTLAMTIGKERKSVSVEFRDVLFFSQPILHDQRKLRLNVALHRGTGRFEVMDGNSTVATGFITLMDKNINRKHEMESSKDIVLDAQDIYEMFYEKEYGYSGEFLSIHSADASLTEANMVWNENWVTLIDGMLQLGALKQKYHAVSQPAKIRKMYIDLEEHMKANIIEFKDKQTIQAYVNELFNEIGCGGIVIENAQFKDLPASKPEIVSFKTLKFIPHVHSNVTDVKTSLQVYLQIVAENTNKAVLHVIEILNSSEKQTIFNPIKDVLNDIPDVKIIFKQICRENIAKEGNIDLVLVQNMTTEDDMCQLLYNVLKSDVFVISADETSHDSLRVRPTSLYRVLASQNNGNTWLHLAKWRPTKSSASTTALTVRTHSDLSLLSSTRDHLPKDHKLIVFTSYPPVDGVKHLVATWRKLSDRNQAYLVMVNHRFDEDQSMVHVPDLDLAYTVLENGTWGGEYYVPLEEKPFVAPLLTLQSKQIGDLNSLSWVETPIPSTSGISVTVHYAGLNTLDSKRATGVYPLGSEDDIEHYAYGKDFSGITDSGVQVMGLLRGGAACSRVHVAPEMMWPVPKHWTLEDAATVPMSYAHAFYILAIKVNLVPGSSILVHGGTGALGQAIISIALANSVTVYTTVSDLRKKHFLRKLFPELKEEHIGNSRDTSFGDMVLNSTKQKGVNYVINCLKGELKNTSLKCAASFGATIDTIQIQSHEQYSFGMYNMTGDKHYIRVDFSSLFDKKTDMMKVQLLVSDGIAKGYVRPLSRVTYLPNEVARAFRLLDVSQHRGRVLLKLGDTLTTAHPRITCLETECHVVVCDDGSVGLRVAERLIARGSRKLLLHFAQLPGYALIKKQYWERMGVVTKFSTKELNTNQQVLALINDALKMGSVEGIYVVTTKPQLKHEVLNALDSSSRKLCPSLKYFAVISADKSFGNQVCLSRVQDCLHGTKLSFSSIKQVTPSNEHLHDDAISGYTLCDALERALRSSPAVTLVQACAETKPKLLDQIVTISGIEIPEYLPNDFTLKEFGINIENVGGILVLLRDEYNLTLSEEKILELSVQEIQDIEDTINGSELKDVHGLDVFISNFDRDELNATTDIVLMPTMTSKSTTREEEFDVTQSYLIIVPGLEGHYERFMDMCERIKTPAVVLQPGLDYPNETVRQMAERFVQILIKKVSLKSTNFYLLGYESGVLVALEMAAIMEELGLTGTIYCVGAGPIEFKTILEEELKEFNTDVALQEATVRQMFRLMSGDQTPIELDADLPWKEKIEMCVRTLLARVALSSQYSSAQFDVAYKRLLQIRKCNPKPHQLRSKLVLMRAAAKHLPITGVESLQQYSSQPITVHHLNTPFAHVLKDLRCATIINQHLHPEIIDKYNHMNHCEMYHANNETFKSASDVLEN